MTPAGWRGRVRRWVEASTLSSSVPTGRRIAATTALSLSVKRRRHRGLGGMALADLPFVVHVGQDGAHKADRLQVRKS